MFRVLGLGHETLIFSKTNGWDNGFSFFLSLSSLSFGGKFLPFGDREKGAENCPKDFLRKERPKVANIFSTCRNCHI